MRITTLFFLLLFAVVISTFLPYFFYKSFVIEDTVILGMEVKDNDHFGLNADADAIKFGMIIPGTSSQRSIIIDNNAAYALKVVILKSGHIADWVKVSENNFILKGNETRQVIFEVSAPENADFENYAGEVKIIFKKILFNK